MEVRGLSLFFCALLLRKERDGRRCRGTGTENEMSGEEGNGKAHLASENRRKVTNPRENIFAPKARSQYFIDDSASLSL